MRSMAAASSASTVRGVEFDTVEATRVLTNGGVAPLGHSGENVPHDVDGPPGRRLGPRQDLARSPVNPRRSMRRSTHSRYRPGCAAPAVSGMMLSWIPTAELSSITTVVSDLALRVAGVAERRQHDPDDPIVARLHEIERSLVTAQRRLRDVARALD